MSLINVLVARSQIKPVGLDEIPAQHATTDGRSIWRIDMPGRRFVYMSSVDKESVAVVNASRFYYYWLRQSVRQDRGSPGACVTKAKMKCDYKYHYAEEGFSHGLANPVPVANIGCFLSNGEPYIGFTDGITRTFWLISNGCKAFPIDAGDVESAQLLNEFCGV